MKSSGIGGQAVLEGVMMKNKDKYAIAVRKPDNEVTVEISSYRGLNDKYSVFKLPILRGVAAFADSMVIGVKALSFSSSLFEEEDEQDKKKENNGSGNKGSKNRSIKNKSSKAKESKNKKTDINKQKNADEKVSKGSDSFSTFIMFFLSIVLTIGIFIIFPFFLSSLVSKKIESQIILSLIEGAIRIILFVGYVVAISQMKDIKRFFQYHGAEHKTINCIERGFELTVENVRSQSKEHKRCGTSFMLFVMLISVIFFTFIRVDLLWLRYLLRVLLIPFVAGLSYELIRLAARSENIIVRVISEPGMWMQRLTTKEPDDTMIEVAIQSVEAVFDWRAFLAANKKGKHKKKNKSSFESKSNQQGNIKGIAQEVKKNENKTKKVEALNDPIEINKTLDKVLQPENQVMEEVSVSEEVSGFEDCNLTDELTVLDELTTSTEFNTPVKDNISTKVLLSMEESAKLTTLDELSSLDKKLFEPQELAPQEKQNQLKEKVKPRSKEIILSSTEIAASLEPDDDEDDEILKALDRFLSSDKEVK